MKKTENAWLGKDTLTRLDGTTFEVPTFESFLNEEELQDIELNAKLRSVWDFNAALGDTIKEKYEHLFFKTSELTNVLVSSGVAGYFWIVTSPEVASIFETATIGFYPAACGTDYKHGLIPMGIKKTELAGTINARWRLYKSSTVEPNNLIIGANDKFTNVSEYAVMKIENFII